MKIRHFMSLAVLSVASMGMMHAQGLLVMDKYTIPVGVKGAEVGRVVVPANVDVTLEKDTSGLFQMSKTGVLSLKKNKALTVTSPISYEVVVKSGNQVKAFEVVKDDFLHNKVVAHRGAWKHSGESQNSLGSLRAAIKMGCQGAEFDVWLTKDNQVAIHHDNDMDGMIMEKSTLADLHTKKLDNGEVLPTLEQYINEVKKQNKTRIVLEIKSNKNPKALVLADSCVQIVHRMKAQAWVDYITFDYKAQKVVRSLDATAHLAFLEPTVDLDLQKLDGMNGIDYHFSIFDKMDRLDERCKALGLTRNAWTVNTEEWMKRFLDLDIEFITTDEPEMLLKMIDTRK